ncbi:Uncharacterized protein HZ326_30812 [Fusarium oxysporum f. sp. albedinis]|nr:Uncharacterized protein HZ326_30812 [Fusarium oxysporum f. sp. albedinis]
MANSLLANRDGSPIGKRWAHNFINRQPELKAHGDWWFSKPDKCWSRSILMLCYVMYIFRPGGQRPRKVPYWGTERAGLEESESIFTLVTEMLLAIKD